MKLEYTVGPELDGKSVKQVLKGKLELSERLVKKLKYANKIFLNTVPVHVNALVKHGDCIEVTIDFVEENEEVIPENINIDILYEDDALIVLNKQPNIVVHPTSSHPNGTIANAVMYHMKSKGIEKKIRPVSRLDRDTSGIIIFAKNQYVQEELIRQMKDKSFRKEYIGIAHGLLKDATGTIDLPIERKPGSIMLRHVAPGGAPSITHFEVLEYLNNATLLKFLLETGRTHQIRVHCQAIGHPLVGDTLYPLLPQDEPSGESLSHATLPPDSGNTATVRSLSTPLIIGRQALHSHKVRFIHPFAKTEMELSAPMPEDILTALEILRK